MFYLLSKKLSNISAVTLHRGSHFGCIATASRHSQFHCVEMERFHLGHREEQKNKVKLRGSFLAVDCNHMVAINEWLHVLLMSSVGHVMANLCIY